MTKNLQILQFLKSLKSLIVPKKELSVRKTTFSQAEISDESGRVPFDKMQVLGKRTEPKTAETKF